MQWGGELASPADAPAALPGRRKRRAALEVLQERLAIAEAKLKKQQAAATAKKAAAAAATSVQQARLKTEAAVAVASVASALAARDAAVNKVAEAKLVASQVKEKKAAAGALAALQKELRFRWSLRTFLFPSAIFQAHAAARKIATFRPTAPTAGVGSPRVGGARIARIAKNSVIRPLKIL